MTRVAFATLGCRVNQVDTGEVQGRLEALGCQTVPFESTADVVVINTCTVTSRADFSDRQLIEQARVEVADARAGASMAPAPAAAAAGRSRAFVKIQDGCQHRCAFCIVPWARGPSRSREPEVVVDGVRARVAAGHAEIVLTGIDMGHYGADLRPRTTLTALLRTLAEIPGLRWLRLSSVLAAYFTPELVEAVVSLPPIVPHLHIPLQSGSDAVLRRMRRPYTAAIYRALVEKLAGTIPDLGLGTDLIAGFPGETDADFEQTLGLVDALPFAYLHVFAYSDRRGTEAARLGDHVSARVVTERSRRLRELGHAKSQGFRARLVGTAREAHVLGVRDRATGRLTGLTDNYVAVTFDGPDALMGRLARVRITGAHSTATDGELMP